MAKTTPSPTLLIVDGHAILHRAFHALPPMSAPDGTLVNAVYGFIMTLLKALRDYAPTHVAVTFDTEAATFRHEAYTAYKATRKEQPGELYAQIAPIEDILRAFRIPVYAVEGFEADDVIGTIVQKTQHAKQKTPDVPKVLILTGDLDTLQLVGPNVHVLALTTSMAQPTLYDEAAVRARFGLEPAQLIDYKALAGDPSDNIPGVAGIGKKTATILLQTFGTVEVALLAAKQHSFPRMITVKVMEKLGTAERDITLGKRLVTIVRDAPVRFSLADTRIRSIDRMRVVALFRKFGFHSLVDRLPIANGASRTTERARRSAVNVPVDQVKTKEALGRLTVELDAAEEFTFYIAHDEGSPRTAHARAIAFKWGERTAVADPWGVALAATAAAFRNPAIAKVTHDGKAAFHLLGRSHVPLAGRIDDTMLMSYLLAPGSRKHALRDVAFSELGVEFRGESEQAVRAIAQLAPRLRERLEREQLVRIYEDIELPLTSVLQRMERHGIALDTSALAQLSRQMHRELDEADRSVYNYADHEFNIDSPQQLKAVLFEELGLAVRGLKKTAKGKGLSTAATELEKLRGAHPIIDAILIHRELKKLVSTYVDALPELIDHSTGRIHTTFHQTITATGRLSSSDPNLQNIPASEPWGPAIRRAFVADDGWALLSLDYSQFELRVAATLSGDRVLQRAFQSGHDIHAATGAEVFGVAPQEVTKDQRRIAKAINFGILYGMGPGTLAQTAGIARAEASSSIERYFAAYPELHAWIEETKALARKRGFVETLFGRRRYLPEIVSGVPMVRAAAERMAVNMPIQGTQADLVKLAMLKADAWMKGKNSEPHERVRLLLQVHDELVFEVRKDFLEEAAKGLVDVLEHVHDLPVSIVVDVRAGRSWGDLEPLSRAV